MSSELVWTPTSFVLEGTAEGTWYVWGVDAAHPLLDARDEARGGLFMGEFPTQDSALRAATILNSLTAACNHAYGRE